MKKIFSSFLAVVAVLSIFSSFAADAATVPVNEGFESITLTNLKKTYDFNDCTPSIKTGASDAHSGSKYLVVGGRSGGFWASFRIPCWSNPGTGAFSYDVTKDMPTGSTPVMDMSKTYSISFYIKFANDADNIDVQFAFYTKGSDGKYVFHDPSICQMFAGAVQTTWKHVSATFCLNDVTNAQGLGTFTTMPDFAEIGIISGSSTADYWLDDVKLVEGTDIPGEKANDNDVWNTAHPTASGAPSQAASTSSWVTPSNGGTTPNNGTSKNGGNTTTTSGDNLTTPSSNGAIADVSDAGAASYTQSGDTNSSGATANVPGDNGGGSLWWLWVVIAVVVVGAGGACLYFFVLKKKGVAPDKNE